VPGIEICTVEKTMERRTSCLQSNVDFLQKTIVKLSIDHQQKLDAPTARSKAEGAVASLQTIVEDCSAARRRPRSEESRAAAGQGCAGGEGGTK